MELAKGFIARFTPCGDKGEAWRTRRLSALLLSCLFFSFPLVSDTGVFCWPSASFPLVEEREAPQSCEEADNRRTKDEEAREPSMESRTFLLCRAATPAVNFEMMAEVK